MWLVPGCPTRPQWPSPASCPVAGAPPPLDLQALFGKTKKRVRKMGSSRAVDVYWVRLADCKMEIGKGYMGGRAQALRGTAGPQKTLWP